LDIDAVADADGVYIAAQHGVEPYRTFIAEHYVAYNRGILGKEAILADLRGKPAEGHD
jgi:hypothetical protein